MVISIPIVVRSSKLITISAIPNKYTLMLSLKFGYTVDTTLGSTPFVFIDNAGEHLLTFNSPSGTDISDISPNVITLSDTNAPNVNVFTLTDQDLIDDNRYILAVAASPSLRHVVVASVYQNYNNPADPLNTFDAGGDTTPGTNGDYTHDITLTLYKFDESFVSWMEISQRVIVDVYFFPQIFTLTWSRFSNRYFTIMYPNLPSVSLTETTPFTIEVIDTHTAMLSSVALTQTASFGGNACILFVLCDKYYIVVSGASANYNSAVIPVFTIPSGVIVYGVDFCTMSITEVDFQRLSVPSRMVDVRICCEEAQFANTTEQPITRKQNIGVCPTVYQKPFPPGVSVSLYEDNDRSSVQLLKFKNRKITIVDSYVFGVPGSFGVAFLPRSKFLVVSISYPDGGTPRDPSDPGYDQLVMFKISKKNHDGKYLTIVQANRPLTHWSRLSVSRDNNYLVASGRYNSSIALNAIQLLQLQQ